MPYALNNGIRIHYHVEGQGPPVMMIHGWSDSLEDWHTNGYVNALKSSYQMILMDARGHGLSDKPRAPEAYVMDALVSDVVAVLDHLGLEQAAYWGHSMGGRIGFSLATNSPERVSAFILGSIDPTNNSPERFHRRARNLSHGMERYLAGVESRWGRMETEEHRDRFLANDALALSALTTSLGNSFGMEGVLSGLDKPIMMYAGSDDSFHSGAQKAAESAPSASFVSLDGLNHDSAFKCSDMVVPHVDNFLTQASR